MARKKTKIMSPEVLEGRYQKYIRDVNSWQNKGYSVTLMTKDSFNREYHYKQNLNEKTGNTKKNIIRELASESRNFNDPQLKKIGLRDAELFLLNQGVNISGMSDEDIKKEYKKKAGQTYLQAAKENYKDKTRKEVWEEIYAACGNDYNSAAAEYSRVFDSGD